jgi:hypothetical protein
VKAAADAVSFDPADLGSWQHLIWASQQEAGILREQGRMDASVARLERLLTMGDDPRLTTSLQPMLEDAWYDLADLQMCLDRPADAERSFARALAATAEAAAQLPAGSARRAISEGRPVFERAAQSHAAGDHAAAYDQVSKALALVGAPQLADATGTVGQIRTMVQHWTLNLQGLSALWLGRYGDAEAAFRGREALPTGTFRDPAGEAAALQLSLAHALAGQGRRDEARAALAPALDYLSGRVAAATAPGFTSRLRYAHALYVAALAEPDDAAGRKARARQLDDAARQLASLSAEARQHCYARELAEEFASTRAGTAR